MFICSCKYIGLRPWGHTGLDHRALLDLPSYKSELEMNSLAEVCPVGLGVGGNYIRCLLS